MQANEKQITISQWYERYAQDVFAIIYLMIGDYQQAEDLTHDTFIKAFKYMDTYRREANSKTWLIKIARNLAIDHFRKKRPIYMIKELFTNRPAEEPLPGDLVAINESKRELWHSLQSLKRIHREIIILRKIQDFSTRETAEILGWTQSRVKVTLHRAMKELKSELTKGGYTFETK